MDETVPHFLAALLRRPSPRLVFQDHAVERRSDDFFLFRIEPGDGFNLQANVVVWASFVFFDA